jgi:hypothetical protein
MRHIYLQVYRQRMNQQGVESQEWKWDHVKEAFLDPKSWFWFALMFSISYVTLIS